MDPTFSQEGSMHITSAPTRQNGQTHSKNSSDFADELFECV